MSRYDKVEPFGGAFKALLAAAIPQSDAGKIFGYGVDANGRLVRGAGQTGVIGVGIANQAFNAADAFDVLQDGEIVEAAASDGTTALTAGTKYYAATDGTISTTNTGTYIGHTVSAQRLIVRVAR